MERAEAAEFLGVSVSTLDRFASQGRLTRGRARRKTRPVTTFDEGELKRLKSEMEQAGRAVKATSSETIKAQDAVGFRLDPHYVKRLAAEGGKQGMSAGEYARRLVVTSLESGASRPEAATPDLLRRTLVAELAPLRNAIASEVATIGEGVVGRVSALQEGVVEEVAAVRESLAQAFYALLVMKLGSTEQEAREFVNETIRKSRRC